jgi:calcineurin-like phosphoesterase family protein
MPSVFLVSDTHFGHAGVCRFTRADTQRMNIYYGS